jgi:hypothetical protein
MTERRRTPPPGSPILPPASTPAETSFPVAVPVELSGTTRTPPRDTLELQVQLGWKPTIERVVLVAAAVGLYALGSDSLAAFALGIVGGTTVPGMPGRVRR